jgi:Flp pilus assembly protein TadD/outer membrane murein-binding lipoprotein Lpp
MRLAIAAVTLGSCLLVGCASTPPPAAGLFADDRFAAPDVRISAADVFALSPAMRAYLDSPATKEQLERRGRMMGLFDALFTHGELRIDYDAEVTRNAAETYATKSGNCLSLLIMTAAFARELGITVRYQTVFAEEQWRRMNGLYVISNHVNLHLAPGAGTPLLSHARDGVVIDFYPVSEAAQQRTRTLEEHTVLAMFMNNRAAEALVRGDLNNAYWWAREALRQDARFLNAYNTLGVIYRRTGHLALAANAYREVLKYESDNLVAMTNLIPVLQAQGEEALADQLARQVARREPDPPYTYFDRGQSAFRTGDFRLARELFAREVDRAEHNPDFHYWLGLTYIGLGETSKARHHITRALESSQSGRERQLYAAKLDRLRAH